MIYKLVLIAGDFPRWSVHFEAQTDEEAKSMAQQLMRNDKSAQAAGAADLYNVLLNRRIAAFEISSLIVVQPT